MADISAWSPVDESNTASPPNGWPENMQVSGINNCARAMMGAVRRFYDTLNSGSFVFSSITCSGNMSVAGVLTAGTVGVVGTITGGTINSNGTITGGTINSNGTITGGTVNSTGDMNSAGNLIGGWVHSTGGMSAAGDLIGGTVTSTGDMSAAGTVSGGGVHSTGDIYADNNITAVNDIGCRDLYTNRNATVSGTLTAGTLNASVASVANAITAGQVTSTGNMSAAGTLTAGAANVTQTLTADHVTTNGIDVFGTINAYTVAVSGTASANLLTANSISSNSSVNAAIYNLRGVAFGFMDAGATYTQVSDPGGANITLYTNGTNTYQNNTHWFQSRGGFSNYARFDSIGTYNQSGSWAVISDDRLKRDVEPYTAGLDALLRITPRRFEYTEAAPWPGRSYGLMASEVKGVVPEMVGEAEFDGVTTQTLTPTHAVYLLINACKELAARVAVLEEGR
jgi:cytoskeletal protein CcmA (bactofilin family)